MAGPSIPHFQNDNGFDIINIGSREFMCCGANAPHDHPHVFLDMGDDGEIVCPYCSTLFKHDISLQHGESEPSDCLYSGI
jgi:uncharacterized Zn-finger protein